jgi:hypothetical protein
MQTYRFFLQLTKDIDNCEGLTGKTVSGYYPIMNNYYYLSTLFGWHLYH